MTEVYRWGTSPPELRTKKQLAAEGLRPARGQKPIAQLVWGTGHGVLGVKGRKRTVRKRFVFLD